MSGSVKAFHMVQVVYKRYASLYFVMGIDSSDNELITLELVHHFVEVLDRYFGNVCELDLIFNFHKVPPSWGATFTDSCFIRKMISPAGISKLHVCISGNYISNF